MSNQKNKTHLKEREKERSRMDERGRSLNYRRLVGSPLSKIKVRNIVESGSFIKELNEVESKVKPPQGYKILKGVGTESINSKIFVAEKIAEKLIVYIQLNPSKHLAKFYKHFFNEDKVKRAYLKNAYIRTILAPKSFNHNFASYSFEGEWALET